MIYVNKRKFGLRFKNQPQYGNLKDEKFSSVKFTILIADRQLVNTVIKITESHIYKSHFYKQLHYKRNFF